MREDKSLPYYGECPPGFHKRKSYVSMKGHRVSPRCIKSQTIYPETSAEFKRKTLETDVTLQKIVNRTLDMYAKDEIFKGMVDNHETLGLRDSKY